MDDGDNLNQPDPLRDGQALGGNNVEPSSAEAASMSGEVARADSQGQLGGGAARQEAQLMPEQELAKQRQVEEQDVRQLNAILQQLSQSLGRIWQAVPANALFIVIAGHGDTADVRRLQVRHASLLFGIQNHKPLAIVWGC